MLQCGAVHCGVMYALQRVAVLCTVLQRVAMCCNMLQCVVMCFSVLQYVAMYYASARSRVHLSYTPHQHDLSTCVAVCVVVRYSVLQCVAACCSVLQRAALCYSEFMGVKRLINMTHPRV